MREYLYAYAPDPDEEIDQDQSNESKEELIYGDPPKENSNEFMY